MWESIVIYFVKGFNFSFSVIALVMGVALGVALFLSIVTLGFLVVSMILGKIKIKKMKEKKDGI